MLPIHERVVDRGEIESHDGAKLAADFDPFHQIRGECFSYLAEREKHLEWRRRFGLLRDFRQAKVNINLARICLLTSGDAISAIWISRFHADRENRTSRTKTQESLERIEYVSLQNVIVER